MPIQIESGEEITLTVPVYKRFFKINKIEILEGKKQPEWFHLRFDCRAFNGTFSSGFNPNLNEVNSWDMKSILIEMGAVEPLEIMVHMKNKSTATALVDYSISQ